MGAREFFQQYSKILDRTVYVRLCEQYKINCFFLKVWCPCSTFLNFWYFFDHTLQYMHSYTSLRPISISSQLRLSGRVVPPWGTVPSRDSDSGLTTVQQASAKPYDMSYAAQWLYCLSELCIPLSELCCRLSELRCPLSKLPCRLSERRRPLPEQRFTLAELGCALPELCCTLSELKLHPI